MDLPEPSSPSTAMSFPGYLGRFETTPHAVRTPFFRNKIFRRTGMSGFRAECRERSIFNLTRVCWTGEMRAEARGFSSALNLEAYVFRKTSLPSVPIREIRGLFCVPSVENLGRVNPRRIGLTTIRNISSVYFVGPVPRRRLRRET